jgi:archaellin
MADHSYKKIKNIQVGDILYEDGEVTSKMVLDANGIEMFELFGLKISGSHKIKINKKWIYICNHPNAVKIYNYNKPYIYCLNTKTKEIHIESTKAIEETYDKEIFVFNDWDEVFEDELKILSKNINEEYLSRKDIHQKFDVGISKDTKIKMKNGENLAIKNIKPGNILINNIFVYGVVEINGKDLDQSCFYLKNNLEKIPILGTDTLHKLSNKYLDKINIEIVKEEKLYYLLTNTGNFYIQDLLFNDYNSAVEIFLLSNNYV